MRRPLSVSSVWREWLSAVAADDSGRIGECERLLALLAVRRIPSNNQK